MVTYREDLNKFMACGCSNPDCKHDDDGEPLCITSRCHPDETPWVAYGHGVVHVFCPICDTPVINIAVASRPSNGK